MRLKIECADYLSRDELRFILTVALRRHPVLSFLSFPDAISHFDPFFMYFTHTHTYTHTHTLPIIDSNTHNMADSKISSGGYSRL